MPLEKRRTGLDSSQQRIARTLRRASPIRFDSRCKTRESTYLVENRVSDKKIGFQKPSVRDGLRSKIKNLPHRCRCVRVVCGFICVLAPHFFAAFYFILFALLAACCCCCRIMSVSHRASSSRALCFVVATIHQSKQVSEFVWTTSMRVLAFCILQYYVPDSVCGVCALIRKHVVCAATVMLLLYCSKCTAAVVPLGI